ncbi:hypothetical protein B0H13DRAFT_2327800 [Mycena leptocephala]|nr:hypothetical protein B0H13DRAFT_2327800 [Mycena leptocephala]
MNGEELAIGVITAPTLYLATFPFLKLVVASPAPVAPMALQLTVITAARASATAECLGTTNALFLQWIDLEMTCDLKLTLAVAVAELYTFSCRI